MLTEFNKGFNSGSVAWQILDHEIAKNAELDRWFERVFGNHGM